MTEYTNVHLDGPWYKHVDNNGKTWLKGHPPKDSTIISKYDIYKLNTYFPYIIAGSIKECFPPRTSIRVPKDQVDYVIDELKKDGYCVVIN